MMWEECKDLQEYIVGLRRDLHQIPEVGFDLPETQAYVTAVLSLPSKAAKPVKLSV